MTIRALRIKLSEIKDQDAEIIFSNDEELNTLRTDGEVCELNLATGKKTYVIYGLDGSEINQ